MIKIDNLSFNYGHTPVLNHISMELREGRIYGLLGENGVGKTTLLTLLSGLKKCSEGAISIDGFNPYDRLPSFLEDLYFLPDEVSSLHVSAGWYADNYGKYWKNFSREVFSEAMKEFETDENMQMDKMSFGQLKKTYICFALACRCRYVFMDEPTNGLDIPSKAQFRKAMMKYTPEDSTTVISTHQVRDLENIIDPVIILDRNDVLVNAGIDEISSKLFFNYSNVLSPDALYSEMVPGGCIQVMLNTAGEESKVNIEAFFNAVHNNKELIKGLFLSNE